MNWLNNFSDILKQFTQKQKMVVLFFLLLFSLLVSLGTVFINGYYKSPDELLSITKTQQENINNLNITVSELQTELLNNSKNCTDSILSIHKRYTNELLEQQNYVNNMLDILKNKLKNDISTNTLVNMTMEKNINDSSILLSSPIIEPYDEIEEYIDIINNIQKNIKK